METRKDSLWDERVALERQRCLRRDHTGAAPGGSSLAGVPSGPSGARPGLNTSISAPLEVFKPGNTRNCRTFDLLADLDRPGLHARPLDRQIRTELGRQPLLVVSTYFVLHSGTSSLLVPELFPYPCSSTPELSKSSQLEKGTPYCLEENPDVAGSSSNRDTQEFSMRVEVHVEKGLSVFLKTRGFPVQRFGS